MDKNQKSPPLSDVNTLLGQTWKIYNARLGTLLGIAAIPMLVLLPLLIIGLAAGFLSFLVSSILFDLGALKGLIPLLVVLGLIVVGVITIWSHLALIYAVVKRKENPGIMESYGKVRNRIMSAVWISMLTGLIVSAGYLFFFVPGIIFTVWFCFSFYVLIAEESRGTTPISRSKKLVSGRWWDVFARLAFMLLVLSVVIYLTGAVSGAVRVPFIGSLLGFIVTPFPVIYSLLIYEDLKKTEILPEKTPAPSEKPAS